MFFSYIDVLANDDGPTKDAFKEISTVATEETLTESAKETYSQIVVNSETQTSKEA